MKLNVFYSEETLAASLISCGYMNFLYDFNFSIKENLDKARDIFEKQVLDDMDVVKSDDDMYENEKEFYLGKLKDVKDKLSGEVDDLLGCFDKICISIENTELLENIDKIIDGINIPVVLNLREIEEEYLIENLNRIDSNLKKKFNNRISYLINQCLNECDSHYEDNSYTLEEVMLVLTTVRNLTDTIRKFNLSPFEQVMYAYDVVKDRYYIASDKDGSYLESRDVAKILKSDKIVCLGFASLFKSLLDNLGFTNEVIFLDGVKDPLSGHARNLISINDPKYDLNHILYFDATWDSKKQNSDIKDENRYNYFAREQLYFLLKDNKVLKEQKYFPYYLRKDNNYSFVHEDAARRLSQIKRIFRMIDWREYFLNPDMYYADFDKIHDLMSDDFRAAYNLGQDSDFCEYIYKECAKMLGRKVDNDNFLRCLYTVRKVENYLNPEKYSLDIDELLDVYYKRVKPKASNEEIFFLRKIMRMDDFLKDMIDDFDKMDEANSREELLIRLKKLNNNIKLSQIDDSVSVKEAIKMLKK